MCNNELHDQLLPTAHFSHHARVAEQLRATAQAGFREVSLEELRAEASEALKLADNGVPKECIAQLAKLAAGEVLQVAS